MVHFLSTSEAAALLGVSRVTVFNKIKSGEIPAHKVGNTYMIHREDLFLPGDTNMSVVQKTQLDRYVDKTIDDYGETLKLLKDA